MIRVYIDGHVVVCNSWLSVVQLIGAMPWRRIRIKMGELNTLAHVVLHQ